MTPIVAEAVELRVYRMIRHRPTRFGTVSIPLMSSFNVPKDERYVIFDNETGGAIGEVRVTVVYQEVAVQPQDTYTIEPVSSAFARSLEAFSLAVDEGASRHRRAVPALPTRSSYPVL